MDTNADGVTVLKHHLLMEDLCLWCKDNLVIQSLIGLSGKLMPTLFQVMLRTILVSDFFQLKVDFLYRLSAASSGRPRTAVSLSG